MSGHKRKHKPRVQQTKSPSKKFKYRRSHERNWMGKFRLELARSARKDGSMPT